MANATESTMLAVLAALGASGMPRELVLVTPSDATDLSDIATKGLLVTADGDVYARAVDSASIILLGTYTTGAYIPGHFSRVGASTTATVAAYGG